MKTKLNPLWLIPTFFLLLGLFVTHDDWWLFALGVWVVIGTIGGVINEMSNKKG